MSDLMNPDFSRPEDNEDDDETSILAHIEIIIFLIVSRLTEFVLQVGYRLRNLFSKPHRSPTQEREIDSGLREERGDNIIDISSLRRTQPAQDD